MHDKQKSQMVYRIQIFILSPQQFKLLPGGTAMGRGELFAFRYRLRIDHDGAGDGDLGRVACLVGRWWWFGSGIVSAGGAVFIESG